MKYELKHVGIWSVAKISFVLGGLFGLFMGMIFWMFGSLISQLSSLGGGGSGMDDLGGCCGSSRIEVLFLSVPRSPLGP